MVNLQIKHLQGAIRKRSGALSLSGVKNTEEEQSEQGRALQSKKERIKTRNMTKVGNNPFLHPNRNSIENLIAELNSKKQSQLALKFHIENAKKK